MGASCNQTFRYYLGERIIRDDRELDGIREYIANNPAQWDQDTDNPKNSHVIVGADLCVRP